MWVTTHVLAGLAIAAALGGPWWLVLLLVIVAHVLMDLVPHWDYTTSPRAAVYVWCDLAASAAAWLLAWRVAGMPFWLAAMGPVSGAPDLDVGIALVRGSGTRKYFVSHWARFPHGRSGRPFGIAVQVVAMAASAAVVAAAGPFG
jgi:hypothetical protein